MVEALDQVTAAFGDQVFVDLEINSPGQGSVFAMIDEDGIDHKRYPGKRVALSGFHSDSAAARALYKPENGCD